MSNVIKFRGKDKETGQWVTGSLLKTAIGLHYIVPQNLISNELITFAVDPETVGQFINVTDELGAEVFDGDVLAHEDGEWSFIARVTHGGYEWFLENIGATDTFSFDDFYDDGCVDMKKVGNIHDNPELLEVEQ